MLKSRVKRLEQACPQRVVSQQYESVEDTYRWIEEVLSNPVSVEELLESLRGPFDPSDYESRAMYEFFENWREQSVQQLESKHGDERTCD